MAAAGFAQAGMGAHSVRMQSDADYIQARTDVDAATENARRERLSASQVRMVGMAAEEAQRRQIRKEMGRSAAALAQAGTGGASYGSNAALVKQAATEAEYDVQTTRYETETEAYGHELEAQAYDTDKLAAQRYLRGAKKARPLMLASGWLAGYSSYSGMRQRQTTPGARSVTKNGVTVQQTGTPTVGTRGRGGGSSGRVAYSGSGKTK